MADFTDSRGRAWVRGPNGWTQEQQEYDPFMDAARAVGQTPPDLTTPNPPDFTKIPMGDSHTDVPSPVQEAEPIVRSLPGQTSPDLTAPNPPDFTKIPMGTPTTPDEQAAVAVASDALKSGPTGPHPGAGRFPSSGRPGYRGGGRKPVESAPRPTAGTLSESQAEYMRRLEETRQAELEYGEREATELGRLTSESESAQAALIEKQERVRSEFEAQDEQRMRAFEGMRLDPDRLIGNMSTGNKIGMGIAILMGGLAQGLLRGGPNQALEIIDRRIDRDIASQKFDIQKVGDSIQMGRGKFKMQMDALADDRNNLALMNAIKKDAIIAKLKPYMAKLADKKNGVAVQSALLEIERSNAETIRRTLEADRDYKLRLGTLAETRRAHKAQEQLQAGAQAIQLAGIEAQSRAARASAEAKTANEQRGLLIRTASGEDVLAPTKKEAAEFRGKKDVTGQFVALVEEIKNIRDKEGMQWEFLNADTKQRIKTLHGTAFRLMSQGLSAGVLSPTELEQMEKLLGGDPTGWYDIQGGLEAAEDFMVGGLNSKMRAFAPDYKGEDYSVGGLVSEFKTRGTGGVVVEPWSAERVMREASGGMSSEQRTRLYDEQRYSEWAKDKTNEQLRAMPFDKWRREEMANWMRQNESEKESFPPYADTTSYGRAAYVTTGN